MMESCFAKPACLMQILQHCVDRLETEPDGAAPLPLARSNPETGPLKGHISAISQVGNAPHPCNELCSGILSQCCQLYTRQLHSCTAESEFVVVRQQQMIFRCHQRLAPSLAGFARHPIDPLSLTLGGCIAAAGTKIIRGRTKCRAPGYFTFAHLSSSAHISSERCPASDAAGRHRHLSFVPL